MVTLGTGLGSGFVANGEMIYGHDGFAGELWGQRVPGQQSVLHQVPAAQLQEEVGDLAQHHRAEQPQISRSALLKCRGKTVLPRCTISDFFPRIFRRR